MDVIEVIDLGFTELEFRSGYAVGRTREGADIDAEHHRRVIRELEQRFDGDYGLILDEVNSYSIRLGAMVEVQQNPRLKCIAIVAYRPATRIAASVSKAAVRKPVDVFDTVEQACEWMEQQLTG